MFLIDKYVTGLLTYSTQFSLVNRKGTALSVIIEGVDASGKSTLAKKIAAITGYTIQESEGPPKYEGELTHRVLRYLELPKKTLFVRHPVISQPIYSSLRVNDEVLDEALTNEVMSKATLIIYCRGDISRFVSSHEVKPDEDPRHIEALNQRYSHILWLYDAWAVRHAHFIYRIGDNTSRMLKICKTIM